MKAYLLIETKKIKAPKKGEWYKGPCEKIHFTLCQDEHVGPHPILAHHEFEIPEEATHLLLSKSSDGTLYKLHLPIHRPKIKKAQYITINRDNLGRKRAEVTGWLTEKEARARGLEPEDRVYQTEIEIEE